jgi:putative PIN family toxin of toxin-antitoxin system
MEPTDNPVMARAVLDTNVLVSALRSRRGASFQILHRLRHGQWTAVLSNHLLYEYEEVLKRHASELRLSLADVDEILNAVSAKAEEWTLPPDWHPILADPDDEPLVQLAEESGAKLIVTHNIGHLQPATQHGIRVLPPREFLAIIAVR